MNQMQSELDALTARVNEAEERISELEDGIVEEKVKTETWLKKSNFKNVGYGRLLTLLNIPMSESLASPRGWKKREV